MLSALKDNQVHLAWSQPDNGGSAITGYEVWRGTASGSETLLAKVGVRNTYTDLTARPAITYFYKVKAASGLGAGPFSNEATPILSLTTQASPCVVPGIQVFTNPSGHQTGAPANAQLNLLAGYVAEPFISLSDGTQPQALVFTLKADNLSPTPQPNGSWKMFFTTADGKGHFADMNTFNVTPCFNYGHIDNSSAGVPTDVTDGPADAGSGFTTDGTITIILSTSKVGTPVAGQALGGIHGETQLLVGATAGLLLRVDSTPSGSYTMFGNAHCQANPAPVASLFDAPSSGNAPLDVTFDASRSFDPGPDAITSYAFNFGDGTSATQSRPIVTHTYKIKGNYTATLVVTNDRQKSSTNRAAAGVIVRSPNHPPSAVLNASSRSGTAPMTVGFDGSQSSDPDPGDAIASYTFDFGDGTAPVTSTAATINHTYQAAGSYTATLVVKNTDGQGSVNNASVTITVNAPLLP